MNNVSCGVTLAKTISRGTWRGIGLRMIGLTVQDVPIGAANRRAIINYTGGTAYQIGRINPANAFVVDRPPLRLLYVRPMYTRYRVAAKKVFPLTPWMVDFDHSLSRKVARDLGFGYVLLIRILPKVNRAHGRFERPQPQVSVNPNKLAFADQRILDKWLGRPPKLMRDIKSIIPYCIHNGAGLGLTLKQAGKWGYAMGVTDDPTPTGMLTPL